MSSPFALGRGNKKIGHCNQPKLGNPNWMVFELKDVAGSQYHLHG
jgi:hypothetical protein